MISNKENIKMSSLAKLNIKSVARRVVLSPSEARRQKLVMGIAEQIEAAEAAARGERYTVTAPSWVKNEGGQRVRVERQKVVRSWFFERDGGFYVQCKYGSKTLRLSKDGNAVFVPKISEVKAVLGAFRSAALSGELDAAIEAELKPKKQ